MLKRFFLLALPLLTPLPAQEENPLVPAAELTHAPTPARVAALVDRAKTKGWGSVTPALRAAAQQAYEGNSGYIPAWYYLYRWSRLLETPYNQMIPEWIKALDAAEAGHPNMPAFYEPKPGNLDAGLSRELLLTLLGSPAVSEEFFQLLSPLDNPSEVLAILQRLHRQDPAAFAQFASLALAIAVVDDVPPPPQWPHPQVTDKDLSRRLATPEQTFAYFVRLDRANPGASRLRRLPASELKFLADNVAPFTELDWARANVAPGLADLGAAYNLVKYRKDRLAASQFTWPDGAYTLPRILEKGGICVDQAYFSSAVGKAKGIPTMMFLGAGLDGRHAWFGFLDVNQKWQLDCGRFAEQKFVVGVAYDPQTWTNINDHELLFITERFRALPTYKLSVIHAAFAADYLQEGKVDQALKSAREAVNRDQRNVEAWNILLAAQAAKSPDLREQEAILRSAVLAFQRYPDLEIAFSRRLVEVLRARKQTSLAQVEEQRLSVKYQAKREDLGTEQAANAVKRSLREDTLAAQIKVYNQVMDTIGRGGSFDFYDKVVVPFVTSLAERKLTAQAVQAMERAQRTLRVEPGAPLDLEIAGVIAKLKKGDYLIKSGSP